MWGKIIPNYHFCLCHSNQFENRDPSWQSFIHFLSAVDGSDAYDSLHKNYIFRAKNERVVLFTYLDFFVCFQDFFFFSLGYSCFAVFCCFLLYSDTNQLYGHISFLLNFTTCPLPTTPGTTEHQVELLELYTAGPHLLLALHMVVCIGLPW